MHPNPLFRSDDPALPARLIDAAGFGMVFAQTPEGPRVAHTPIMAVGDDRLQFHLARSNALTRHLAGAQALIVVNGPDGYVSPRWYDNRDTVPTWNYIALESEGAVRQIADDALEAFLHAAILRHESLLGGTPWQAHEASPKVWEGLFRGIVGFEMTVTAMRPTLKLSQNKSPRERAAIAEGLAQAGKANLAQAMLGDAA